jgi:cobaltochelatase CobS
MVFEPGPLAFAMRYGLIYCADEYDFALPSVTSVYQPVMEGKALVIKEAPPEWRVVKPHPNFRFFATGNTNGSGDESGLYQGTQIMNAANYSRFGVTIHVPYMEAAAEESAVAKQANITPADAKKLVQFAKHVRDAYANGEISVTVSPRELINAGKIGLVRGLNWRLGLEKAYINRLSSTDKKAVGDFAQRVFGGTHY